MSNRVKVLPVTVDNLYKEYQDGASLDMLAKKYSINKNTIYRHFLRRGFELRDKSAALKIAAQENRHYAHWKGKKMDEEVKQKVGDAVRNKWKNATPAEKKKRSDQVKEQYKNRKDKQSMTQKGHKELQKTSRRGSALEHYIVNHFLQKGEPVMHHAKNFLPNQNLETDVLLPRLKTVIEVDGPTHFQPIYGEARLATTTLLDNQKNGLLLNWGYKVIRVKNIKKNFSESFAREVCKEIENNLGNPVGVYKIEV